MNRFLPVVLAVWLLVPGGCAVWQSSQALEREQLHQDLGWDPEAQLASIGTASSSERAQELAWELREPLTGQQELRLLRFGLGHDSERVVFGAVVLMERYDRLPVPELRHAAAVVVPRFGEADCPVTIDQVNPLIGSGNFAALVDVIPRLPEQQAIQFLGALHRMVRPDAIGPLCELAKISEGEVRRSALGNAVLAAEYSDEHVEQLVATCVELAGCTVDPKPPGGGLPGLLRAALWGITEDKAMPLLPCARWLVASTPGPEDLALLRQLLGIESSPMREAAAWALGSMRDEESRELLASEPVEDVSTACWLAARARRGDTQALDQLLAGDGVELCYGLAVASPARRRAFFEHLLALSDDRAHEVVIALGDWASGQQAYAAWALPPYAEHRFVDLEPMVFNSGTVGVSLLRALVASLPCCETERLADMLLALPPSELFSPVPDGWSQSKYLGHGGVWAFLEVTRSEAFRRRLHEGLLCDLVLVRDLCAELLISMGDTERLIELVAWIDEGHSDVEMPLALLARDGDPKLRELLSHRARTTGDVSDLIAFAVSLGLPLDQAGFPHRDEVREAAAREALLAGDVGTVMRLLLNERGFHSYRCASVLFWRDAVTADLLEWRRSAELPADSLYEFDQVWEWNSGDQLRVDRVLQPLRDGRYATHDAVPVESLARVGGLAMLPFWIEQLGTNCCKVVTFEEVLKELFGHDSSAYSHSEYLEPASVYLRRTLLPVVDRLRWSRIANGYVVAGR